MFKRASTGDLLNDGLKVSVVNGEDDEDKPLT